MPPERGEQAARFKQVEALFEAAQQQPVAQRPAFLRQACPDNPDLRAEVESLLKASDSGDNLLDGSPLSSLTEPALALKPGDKLGNFEIVAMLGRGGMGEVYRARDLRLKRDVAIKTLPPGFAADRDRITRFEREARAAGALNHPNIVSVFDIGAERGVSYIVSELVDGDTLAELLERGPLLLRKLIEFSAQICDGLAAAHAAKIVHRDLKPGNIMLTRDGRVKILDFGLARHDRAPGIDSTTMEASHPGMIMGTPGYMSPEQVRGQATDARSDLFSLGVILYEMASGQRAFRGSSSIEVMNSILKEDPPELPPASPPSLDRLVRRCIEKDPARRFQSAADLGFALNSLRVEPQPHPAMRAEPSKRPWLKWPLLGAIALVAGGTLWIIVSQKRPVAPPEFTLRRFTNDSVLIADAAISPDGKLVAFSRPQPNSTNRDIWVQQVDGGNAVRITDDPADDHDPVFSPDGTQIAFSSDRQGGGMYLVPALGGEARQIGPTVTKPQLSPDFQWLLYWEGDQTRSKVYVRRVSGGAPRELGATYFCSAVWSPDSRHILVQECGIEDSTWVSSVDGKHLKPNHDLDPNHGVIDYNSYIYGWMANPSRLIILKRVADAYVLLAVPVSADGTKVTGSPQKLTSLTDPPWGVSIALDGRMVLSVWTTRGHIWGLPIDARGHPAGALRQITAGSEGEYGPELSSDGRKLAFNFQRANGQRLLYEDLTTGHQKEISTDEGVGWNGVFNKDGSGVMAGHYEAIHYLPLSGGLPKKIWGMPKRMVWLWDWSPDGKTLLLFTDIPRSGVVRQLNLGSLSLTPFLEEPDLDTWQAHFSHDGRWVVFNATNQAPRSRIYIAPFRNGAVPRSEWIPITDGDWDDKPRFSSDDKMIFFVKGKENEAHSLWSQRLNAFMRPDGKPVAVYSPPDGRRVITFDNISVSSGLIVFTQTEPTGNIWLAEPVKGATK